MPDPFAFERNLTKAAILTHARTAKTELEALLELLGWPKPEPALSQAIDRLVQLIEEQDR